MDPITLAITTAISTGVLSSTTEVAKQGIIDLYAGLKHLIKQKYGDASEVNQAIESLEKKPNSDARKKMVEEEVIAAEADQDPEIIKAAQALIDSLQMRPNITQNIQTAIGSNIVQADRGGKATLNIDKSKKIGHG